MFFIGFSHSNLHLSRIPMDFYGFVTFDFLMAAWLPCCSSGMITRSWGFNPAPDFKRRKEWHCYRSPCSLAKLVQMVQITIIASVYYFFCNVSSLYFRHPQAGYDQKIWAVQGSTSRILNGYMSGTPRARLTWLSQTTSQLPSWTGILRMENGHKKAADICGLLVMAKSVRCFGLSMSLPSLIQLILLFESMSSFCCLVYLGMLLKFFAEFFFR